MGRSPDRGRLPVSSRLVQRGAVHWVSFHASQGTEIRKRRPAVTAKLAAQREQKREYDRAYYRQNRAYLIEQARERRQRLREERTDSAGDGDIEVNNGDYPHRNRGQWTSEKDVTPGKMPVRIRAVFGADMGKSDGAHCFRLGAEASERLCRIRPSRAPDGGRHLRRIRRAQPSTSSYVQFARNGRPI